MSVSDASLSWEVCPADLVFIIRWKQQRMDNIHVKLRILDGICSLGINWDIWTS